jgi:hypothetical protein
MTARDADEAVANANARTSYESGMCQQFVRGQCWEVPAVYGSAIEAWMGARHKHPGDRNPPKGAPCFYKGSGEFGHVVIAKADGMRSTDCTTTGRVSDAALSWPEANWNAGYLGWTSDLNGVDLPLGGGDDDMTEDDWKKLRGIVRDEVWERKLDVDKPDGTPTKKSAGQIIRETLQRVQK